MSVARFLVRSGALVLARILSSQQVRLSDAPWVDRGQGYRAPAHTSFASDATG